MSSSSGFDEVHKKQYWRDPTRIPNYMVRMRDPHSGRMSLLATGLPMSGHVRETFDVPLVNGEGETDRIVVLSATSDNPFVPPETLAQYRRSCPAGYEHLFLDGKWAMDPEAVFGMWDAAIHLTDDEPDPNVATSFGLDVGNHGAVVFGQPKNFLCRNLVGQTSWEPGTLIMDQLLTRDASVRAMCQQIKIEKPWPIIPGQSVIAVDPTIRRDELRAIYTAFPKVQVIRKKRGQDHYPIEDGIRTWQAALLDSNKNTHLQVVRKLAGERHGIVDYMQTAKRNELTQKVVKDNARDHCGDAGRYLIQHRHQDYAWGAPRH